VPVALPVIIHSAVSAKDERSVNHEKMGQRRS